MFVLQHLQVQLVVVGRSDNCEFAVACITVLVQGVGDTVHVNLVVIGFAYGWEKDGCLAVPEASIARPEVLATAFREARHFGAMFRHLDGDDVVRKKHILFIWYHTISRWVAFWSLCCVLYYDILPIAVQPVREHLNNLPVRRQPLHAVELIEREPAGGLVLEEGQRAALHGAEEAVHREVELRVVPLDGVQQFPDGDAGLQLLPDLAAQRLLGRLPGFNLAARELPPVLPVARPPLCGEDAVLGIVDNGGGNGDVFHSLFVLVQYDQRANNAWHPSSAGEDEDYEDGPAPAVDDSQGREKDGEEDAEYGHGGLFFEGFQCAAELIGAGGGLSSAADAVEFWDDIVDFLTCHQTTDSLQVTVATAIKEDLPDDALVIDGHIDELRAGALGFVEGVGHKYQFF